jgi:hypothetical protein
MEAIENNKTGLFCISGEKDKFIQSLFDCWRLFGMNNFDISNQRVWLDKTRNFKALFYSSKNTDVSESSKVLTSFMSIVDLGAHPWNLVKIGKI